MKLRTELPVPKQDLGLDLFGGMVFMGSCFSDNIGGRLSSLGVPALVNPFGVIFHPEPLLRIIEQAIDPEFSYSESHLLEHQGMFYSLNHHGSFKGTDNILLLERLNGQLSLLRKKLAESSTLFLTLGTAWGYEYEDEIVANCHKLPNDLFTKSISSYSSVLEKLTLTINSLATTNPNLKVIMTVSPVRHIKNGIVEDSRSKSILHSAVHEVVNNLSNAHYFPSFELMMDDLRDYRFYKSDLIHPSDLAIDYIFDYFSKSHFSDEANETLKELAKFSLLQKHKPMDNSSKEALALVKKLQQKKEELQRKYDQLTF